MLLASCGDSGGTTTTPAPAAPAPPPPSPLSWAELPEEITVGKWTAETFVARLSEAVEGATYEIMSSGAAATVEGESPEPGVFEGTVTGVEAGEVTLTLTASHPGYETAIGEIGIVVEDLLAGFDRELFDLEFWRQMVFNALVCPTGSEHLCRAHAGLSVEERTVAVYSGRPDFLIRTPVVAGDEGAEWGGAFSESEIEEIEDRIRDAWEQLTGLPFTQTIRVSGTPVEQEGWIEVWAVTDNVTKGHCGGLVSLPWRATGNCGPRRGGDGRRKVPGAERGPFPVGERARLPPGRSAPGPRDGLLAGRGGFLRDGAVPTRGLAFALGRGAPYTDDPLAELQGSAR